MSSKAQDTVEIENQSYVGVGGLDKNDFIVSSSISAVLDAVRTDLSSKLDCQTGLPVVSGTIYTTNGVKTSGDVEICRHSLRILSGNYIQTDDNLGYVQNYSDRNSFLQAECSQKYHDQYGIACTGTRGYCILSSDVATKTLILSGDLSELQAFVASNPSTKWSTSFESGSYSQELQISTVVQDTLEWGHIVTTTATKIGNQTSAVCLSNWLSDDNAFYCPIHPEIGNTTIPAFYGNHAEGAATKAIQRCTHAEGRNTISEIRYSHAEGSDTYAAEMYSHAEGNTTKALGRAAHSEGDHTTAASTNSHAEGSYTRGSGTASHAEGLSAIASGPNAHAEGQSTQATGEDAHAEGRGSIASGNRAHSEGYYTKAYGYNSHTEGYQANTGVSATYSHAEGMFTKTSNQSEHAQGQYNVSNKKGIGGEFGVNASGNTLHSIGFGTSETTRKNAVEVMQNGDVYVYGIGGYVGTSIASASTLPTALKTLSTDLSTDYTSKTNNLKTLLKENLSAVTALSGLTRTSTIEEVAIDAVLSLRDMISALVDAL